MSTCFSCNALHLRCVTPPLSGGQSGILVAAKTTHGLADSFSDQPTERQRSRWSGSPNDLLHLDPRMRACMATRCSRRRCSVWGRSRAPCSAYRLRLRAGRVADEIDPTNARQSFRQTRTLARRRSNGQQTSQRLIAHVIPSLRDGRDTPPSLVREKAQPAADECLANRWGLGLVRGMNVEYLPLGPVLINDLSECHVRFIPFPKVR